MPKIPNRKKTFWEAGNKIKYTKVSNHQDFYNSTTWHKVRDKQIAKQPLCEVCLNKNIDVPANQVDHIIAINFGGEKLNMENLQSLCYQCHGRKSYLEYKAQKTGNIIHFKRGSLDT